MGQPTVTSMRVLLVAFASLAATSLMGCGGEAEASADSFECTAEGVNKFEGKYDDMCKDEDDVTQCQCDNVDQYLADLEGLAGNCGDEGNISTADLDNMKDMAEAWKEETCE